MAEGSSSVGTTQRPERHGCERQSICLLCFIDSNIPMYLVGAAHPHKADAQRLLETAIERCDRLVSSAEVLQEILHRYTAINRRDAIQPAFDVLLGVVDEIFPVEVRDLESARSIVLGKNVSARDALHAAVMNHRKVKRIMTFDITFDRIPGVERVS